MEKEQFGCFVAQLRKEKGLTQKELGELINLTDKAISKWERGLSFPDVSVLEELAGALDVSVAELLKGQRISEDESMKKAEAVELIDYSLRLSDMEMSRKKERLRWIMVFLIMLILLLTSVSLNVMNAMNGENLIINDNRGGEEDE